MLRMVLNTFFKSQSLDTGSLHSSPTMLRSPSRPCDTVTQSAVGSIYRCGRTPWLQLPAAQQTSKFFLLYNVTEIIDSGPSCFIFSVSRSSSLVALSPRHFRYWHDIWFYSHSLCFETFFMTTHYVIKYITLLQNRIFFFLFKTMINLVTSDFVWVLHPLFFCRRVIWTHSDTQCHGPVPWFFGYAGFEIFTIRGMSVAVWNSCNHLSTLKVTLLHLRTYTQNHRPFFVGTALLAVVQDFPFRCITSCNRVTV